MKQIPIVTNLWNALTAPSIPATSIAISESQLVLMTLRQVQGEFEPRQSAMLPLPTGLITPGFAQPNISDEGRLLDLLRRLAEQAALRSNRIGNFNLALPAGSARSFLIALESVPASRSEMQSLLDWKIERSTGYPIDQLQVSLHRLADQPSGPHWLVTVIRHEVLAPYESVFRQLGWRPGLILPRHLCEVAWLRRSGLDEDQILISLNPLGFEVVIVRGAEPILVREVESSLTNPDDREEMENEFYRMMIYYRDRLVPPGHSPNLTRVLTIGTSADQQRFRELVSTALERSVTSLNAAQIGLRLDPGMSLSNVAAAAGLASMAW